jgi:hypothetical protein
METLALTHVPVALAKAIEPNRRIQIEWPGYSGPTTVEWRLDSLEDDATFVDVTETGFEGSGDNLVKYVADSTQGFSLMLAGMKALLEHDLQPNLTADRFPNGLDAKTERGDQARGSGSASSSSTRQS